MTEKPNKNIAWSIFAGIFTVILGLLLMLDLVLVIYTTNISGTILNRSFIESELEKADIYSAAKDVLAEKKDEFLGELGEIGSKIYNIIETSLSQEWTQSQVHTILNSLFSYLNKESDDLDLSLSLAGLKENLKTSLSQSIHESPPEGLEGLSSEDLDKYLEQAYQGIDSLPGEIGVEVSNLQALEPLRNAVEGLSLINYILIAAAILFALLLISLHFSVRAGSRAIGFPLLLGGAIALIVGIVGTRVASNLMAGIEFPAPLSAEMATTIVQDFLAAPNLYIYAIMAIGLALIIVSFIYQKRRRIAHPQ